MNRLRKPREALLSTDRLNGNDKRVLLIWILAGLLGAAVAHQFFYRAFPEASVEFKVTRAAALAQARQFATAQGLNPEGYRSSIVFDVDDTAKTYLEREVGLAQADQMMKSNVHIWYWHVRFFRPLQKEEIDARIDPAGGIVGYGHVLEETASGARLDRSAAQTVAESFLTDTLHIDLSRYDFREEEANFTEKPNRRDWSFSWELRRFRAKDAPYRLQVTLAGDRVDGYQEILKVPEAWKLNYARIRSSNDLAEYIALIPFSLLLGGCLYVIFMLERRGLLHWQGGLALGAFLTVLYFVMTMNQWPVDLAGYDTNTSYSTFFLSQIGQAALTSIASALLVVLAVVPGEPLYRELQPAKIRLGAGLRLPGMRTKEFFTANVIGICLAAAHIGYITIFYIVGGKLGVWAPQDLSYSDVVSTYLPWIYPLAIGIYAATSEEFLFRLFAIPFVLRTTNSRILAVVLPAFAWGFLHSNYPQEPAYIRGIEVGLMGIVAGLVMLRWGIWATLTWHYTVDAFLISTSLLRSHGAYLKISGAIVGGGALIPLAIAGISYLMRGRFETSPALLNSAEPLVVAPDISPDISPTGAPGEDARETIAQKRPGYAAMSSRSLAILIFAGLAGVALLAGIKREAIGDFVRFSIRAREATARADQVLRNNKIDPASYRHATTITYTFDGYNNEYLAQKIGIAAANRIYRDQVPSAFWTIRYFRDSQNEEYFVVLKPDGSFHSLHHTLDEKTPGSNLSKENAQALAEAYLRDQKQIDLSAWNLVDSSTEKRPARTDTTFIWEQKTALDAAGPSGAHVRMQVEVQGDEVSGYRVFIKIPDAWRDQQSRTTTPQILQMFGIALLVVGTVITVLVVALRSLRSSEMARVPWRRLVGWSVWVPVAAIVVFANTTQELLQVYQTTWPLKAFYAVLFILLVFRAALYFAAAFILLGVAWFFVDRCFGWKNIPAWIGMQPDYYRDALCTGLFGTTAALGLSRLTDLFARWPLLRHTLSAAVPENLDALNPAASAMASAVSAGIFMIALVALTAALIAAYVRPLWMRVGLAVLVAALVTTNVATPGSFLRGAALYLLAIGIQWFAVSRIIRFNMMGYFLLAAMLVLLPAAVDLLQQPNTYFHANGYAIAAFALALLAWPLMLWRRGIRPPASGQSSG